MPSIDKHLSKIYSWDTFFQLAKKLDNSQKGNLFERLTQLILLTKPEYHSKLKNVWRVRDQIPKNIKDHLQLPNTDEGIDLIAETNEGEYWAIQCKFKGDNSTTTVKEIATFGNLCNSYCKNLSQLILSHTGEKEVKKKHLLGEFFTQIGLEFWLSLKEEDWEGIHKYLQGKSIRPAARNPRPHQQEAIEAAKINFQNSASRGRLLMPCGTGKSLTAFWIANALNAKSIIVAVPSLSLIKQSLEDWTREFLALNENPIPEWLCICSDESTGTLEKDEFVSDTYSLGIPTTTAINKIEEFLLKKNLARKIIFTTYQSSDKLAQAATNVNFTFDLGLIDEAHKTVGVKSKNFSTLLSDGNIKIHKRIFMTATERVVRGNNEDVYSMDDEATYGKQFYHLSFKKAIHSEPKIISDYKILTFTVTNEEIKKLIIDNKLITDSKKEINEQEAQSLAAAIALRKAYEIHGIKHAVSFHRSIKAAERFTGLNKTFNSKELFLPIVQSHHISSKKSAGERAQLMKEFSENEYALMTNARCLTEGVDVPAIDCVLFADPKQSTVDIIQAAGRALRPYPGKKFGYIMLPLIVPENMTFEEFSETTVYKQIGKIITALSTQDERIAEELRITNSGKRNNVQRIIIEGKIPVGLKLDFDLFADKVNSFVWEKVGKANYRSFDEARKFSRSLNFKTINDWRQYCKSKKKPSDIPTAPHEIYKNSGWVSVGDWLGTNTIAPINRRFLSFEEIRVLALSLNIKTYEEWKEYCKISGRNDLPTNPNRTYKNEWKGWKDFLGKEKLYLNFREARDFVHTLNLKSQTEWTFYCKSKNKPEDIPTSPASVYKKSGWINWKDWLGNYKMFRTYCDAKIFVNALGFTSTRQWLKYCRSGAKPKDIPGNPLQLYKFEWTGWNDWLGDHEKYLVFEEARDYVHFLNLKSSSEWQEYCKSAVKPKNIPGNPRNVYKNKGWISFGDWLGTGTVYKKTYRPFEEAKKFIRTLKLKNDKQWQEYRKSGKKPIDIPSNPNIFYKNKGWISLGDWFGTSTIQSAKLNFQSFDNAKRFVHSLKLKNGDEWKKYSKSGNKPSDIPTAPWQTYKNKGWISMGDWLDTGRIAGHLKEYLPFKCAREYAHTLKLKSSTEWSNFSKEGQKPENIPACPNNTYRKKGWINWGDWLGTKTVAPHLKEYRPFKEARDFVHSLKIKKWSDWKEYCKSGEKPADIPSNPNLPYKNKGFTTYRDWLGK